MILDTLGVIPQKDAGRQDHLMLPAPLQPVAGSLFLLQLPDVPMLPSGFSDIGAGYIICTPERSDN